MEDRPGRTTDRNIHSPKSTQAGHGKSPRLSGWTYIIRWVILCGALTTTIISLIWIRAPKTQYAWILLSPLYPLPYPVLSLIWETVEMLAITIRHNKSKGIQPAAHVGCELVLCMSGAAIGSVWISTTFGYLQDSYFTSGESGVPVDSLRAWASVTYFWCALILLMAVGQFIVFVLSCIEVDRKRRQLEYQVSHIMKVIEERGGNAEDLLRSLQEAPKPDQIPKYPPAELSAINYLNPAELSVEERLTEMGEENRAGEMPANTPREAKTKYRF